MLDSTSDFPDAAERFPNMRVVPLYVNFGAESFKDHVDIGSHDFYERLKAGAGAADDLAADAAGLPRRLRAARRATSGSTRCSSRRSSPGRTSRPSLAAAEVGGDRDPRRRHGDCVARGRALLALAIQRRLARGTTDEEIEALIERFKEENGVVFTVATLEYLQKGGRIGRAQALAGTLLNVKPILSIDDGVVHPIGKVRGRQKALEEFARVFTSSTENVPGPARRDRARRRTGVDRGAHRPRREGAAAGRDRARREPRRRRRHPCRPGRGRLLLVPGRRVVASRRQA